MSEQPDTKKKLCFTLRDIVRMLYSIGAPEPIIVREIRGLTGLAVGSSCSQDEALEIIKHAIQDGYYDCLRDHTREYPNHSANAGDV